MNEQLPEVDDADRPLLVEEFRAAWSHYQHLENARGRHLASILAAVIAVLGIVGALLRSPADAAVWVVIALLFSALAAASYFVRQMVLAYPPVLSHYENVLQRARLLYYKKSAKDLEALFNVRSNPDVLSRSDSQRISTLTQRFVSGVFLVSLIAAVVSLGMAFAQLC